MMRATAPVCSGRRNASEAPARRRCDLRIRESYAPRGSSWSRRLTARGEWGDQLVKTVVVTKTVDEAELAELLRPRDAPVRERALGDGVFELDDGPFDHYRRE